MKISFTRTSGLNIANETDKLMIAIGVNIFADTTGSEEAPNGSPSALTLTVDSDTAITLNWTIGSTNHDGHRLYMSTDGGVNYSLKASVTGSTNTVQATGLTAGTLYYFYVVAYKGGQESPASNIVEAWDLYWMGQSLFYMDGTIIDDGGTKYFEDKSANGRDFLITSYDFDVAWTTGFPYKSIATISAPAADAALIAADINNFLYDAGGTPNQIPVVSLFQDIDYEHKIFCKHEVQVVDSDDIETYEPRVSRVFMASDVLTGATLTQAQTYFGVPSENTTTMAWVATTGNDSTGNGSKATPYKTLDKIKATAKTVVYLRSGSYTTAAQSTFAGNELTIIGTGLSSIIVHAVAYVFTVNRNLNIYHCNIDGTAATSYPFLTNKFLKFYNCKLTKTAGTSMVGVGAGTTDIEAHNCVTNLNVNSGLIACYATWGSIVIDTCYGSMITNIPEAYKATNITIKHSSFPNGTKFGLYNTTSFDVKDNYMVGNTNVTVFDLRAVADTNITSASFTYNKVVANNTNSFSLYIGEKADAGTNAINGIIFKHNHISQINASAVNNHCIFLGGGINFDVKYNYVTTGAGYGIVIKAGGSHYTTTNAHVSYNVFNFTGETRQAVYGRGVYGLIVANNTVLGFRGGTAIFHVDDNSGGLDNSMLCENNLVSLGGNTTNYYAGTNMTVINNSINKNGFTLTQAVHANDDLTAVVIGATGVPASRIDDGVAIAGATVGLASDYSIPDAITYKNQDANWQRGAVVL